MRNFLLVLIFFSLGIFSAKSSQIDSSVHPLEEFPVPTEQDQETKNWKFLKQSDNVKIYFAIELCNNNPLFIFKVVNENDFVVTVEWKSEILLSDNPVAVDEKLKHVVNANSSVTGNCNNASLTLNPYKYVSSVNEKSTSYKITNLKIDKK